MMNRRHVMVRVAAAAAAACLGGRLPDARAADAPAVPRLTAQQIVERNVNARGGLAAWRAVTALAMTGQVDAGGKQDVKLPFTMTLKRPHSSRVELRFQEQTALQVYDGTQGWKLRPFLNRSDVEPYTADEARSAAVADELDGLLIDHQAKGSTVELAGVDSVEGRSAYRLRLSLKNGQQRQVWVDAASFLELKTDGEPRRLDGKLRAVSLYYRDYKRVSGLMLPHTLETVVDGVKATHKMHIESVRINPPLDAAAFAKPRPPASGQAS